MAAANRNSVPSHLTGDLRITSAFRCVRGRKERNEDSVGLFMPLGPALVTRGFSAVVADGVSAAEAAAEAARMATEEFIQDYYDTPDSWQVRTAASRVITTLNRRLYKLSSTHKEGELRGHLTTLSALILKSDQVHIFHVGDSRIYRLRSGTVEQLTQDHSIEIGDHKRYLSRALGMELDLNIDCKTTEARELDLYLLCTDGITDFLTGEALAEILQADPDLETLAQRLVDEALAAGSSDNLTCLLLRVDRLHTPNLHEVTNQLSQLPFPPPLEPGQRIDGYRVEDRVFASPRSHLYRVTDEQTGRNLVLKAPSENYSDDPSYIERFILEEWVGLRLNSPHIVKVIPQVNARHFLYYLMDEVPGASLESWIKDNPDPDPARVIYIIQQIAEGVASFHSRETLHQDLKPGNILISPGDHATIVDFGSVHIAGIDEIRTPLDRDRILGTVHYTDPALRVGLKGSIKSDLFSLATITYEMMTGHLPYGEALENCDRKDQLNRLRYIPADRYNPIIPVWFDRTLERAVSPWPEHRHHSIADFLQDLQEPNPELLDPRDEPTSPLRTSVLFWQIMSAIWLVSLIFLATAFWLME